MGFVVLSIIAGTLAFGADVAAPARQLHSIQLRDAAGNIAPFSLDGRTSVVVFYSIECPISNGYNDRMNALYRDYTAKGVQVIVVNANQNESLRAMIEHAKSAEFIFPVYKDAANALADQLGATVTPETFVFDSTGVLRYHGHIDDARNAARAQVQGLRNALEEVLGGKAVTKPETKAFGCTIKRVRKAS